MAIMRHLALILTAVALALFGAGCAQTPAPPATAQEQVRPEVEVIEACSPHPGQTAALRQACKE
jgi:PBP1b-binding outer membrane lipoprotein LpoB